MVGRRRPMHVSEAPEIRVVVFVNDKPVTVPKSIEQKLSRAYQEISQERRIAQEVRKLKKEILFKKIRKLVPEAPIPPLLLNSGVQDDLFQTISMFTDMCRHARDASETWKVDDAAFTHHRFQEIEEIYEMLITQIQGAIETDEKTQHLIQNLLQSIKKVAYFPCKRRLAVMRARKILPSMSEMQKEAILNALEKIDQVDSFYELSEVCRQIIEMRKTGDTSSDKIKVLYKKATNLLAAVFSLCRAEKDVTDTAQDMINAARRAEPSRFWLW